MRPEGKPKKTCAATVPTGQMWVVDEIEQWAGTESWRLSGLSGEMELGATRNFEQRDYGFQTQPQ